MAPAKKIARKAQRGPKPHVAAPKKTRNSANAKAKPTPSNPSQTVKTGPDDEALEREHRGADRTPVEYTYRLSEEICRRLANGESGAEICRDRGMPPWYILAKWVRTKPDFAKRYRAAREMGCEYWADEIVEIADDARNDWIDRHDRKGRVIGRTLDREHFERSRLRVNMRQWLLSKLARHTYGDKGEAIPLGADGVSTKAEERNALITAIVGLVNPKADGKTKPSERAEERRER